MTSMIICGIVALLIGMSLGYCLCLNKWKSDEIKIKRLESGVSDLEESNNRYVKDFQRMRDILNSVSYCEYALNSLELKRPYISRIDFMGYRPKWTFDSICLNLEHGIKTLDSLLKRKEFGA